MGPLFFFASLRWHTLNSPRGARSPWRRRPFHCPRRVGVGQCLAFTSAALCRQRPVDCFC